MKILLAASDITSILALYFANNVSFAHGRAIEVSIPEDTEITIDIRDITRKEYMEGMTDAPTSYAEEPDQGSGVQDQRASNAVQNVNSASEQTEAPRRRRRTKAEMEAAAAAEAEAAAQAVAEPEQPEAEADGDQSLDEPEEEQGEVILTEEAEVPVQPEPVVEEARTEPVKTGGLSLFPTASSAARVPEPEPEKAPSTTKSLFSNLSKPVNTPSE